MNHITEATQATIVTILILNPLNHQEALQNCYFIYFMCTTLYFDIYMHYGMLTTKALVSIFHYTADFPLYISPSLCFPSSLVTTALVSVSNYVFFFFSFCLCLFLFTYYVPHMSEVIHYCLSPPDLFHSA